MLGRFTVVLVLTVAGCGSRSSLQAGGGRDASGGGGAAGGPTGSAGAGAVGPGGSGAGTTGTGTTGTAGPGGGLPQISVVDACTVAVSCGREGGWGPTSVSHCVDAFSRLGWSFEAPPILPDPTLSARILACASETGSDCEAFRACYGGDWVTPYRCREGAYCDGDLLSAGPDGPVLDCGTLGATCQDLWSGAQRACCNAEPCVQVPEIACEGTVVSYCGGWGEHIVFDCGVSGRTCQTDVQAPCLGTGGPCDPFATKTTCAGSVATYCSGGKLAQYDCAQTVYRTACNQGGLAYEGACVPEHTSCSVWQGDTCAGEVVMTCLNGLSVGVSCSALGFSGCEGSGNAARCVE